MTDKEIAEAILQGWFITMKQYDEYPSRLPTIKDALAVMKDAEVRDVEISFNYRDYGSVYY